MKLTRTPMTTKIHQLESEVHRLNVENKRLKRILAFEANTLAGELLEGEERLDQAHRDLRSVLNNMPAMIGYWDRNLRNRFGNTAYVEWFGDAAASMTGKHLREVIGEERYQLNLPYIEAALRGELQEFERAIPTSDGKQVRHTLARYIPDISDGEVQGFYAMVSDVTSLKQTETAVREKDEKLNGLYELSRLGIAMANMSGRFVEFNAAFCVICGYEAQELKALDYWKLTPEKYAASEAIQLETIRRTGHFGPYEKEYIRKDGSLIPLSLSGVLITGKDDQPYIWCIVEDISERKRAEAEVRESEKSLNEAQTLAQIGSYITDLKTGVWKASPALEQIFGIDSSFVTNIENWGKLMAPGYEKKMLDYYQSVVQGDGKFNMDYEIIRPCDGQTRWVAALGQFIYDADGTPAFLKGTIQDITERKLAEQQIRKLAFFDSLTGLPNRRLLMDRLQHALASSVRRQQYGALILIDLDNFKNINDTLGHKQGDLFLQQVAQRLEACVRDSDTVSRLGGDEFVVLLEDLGEDALQAASQAAVVAEKVRLQLSRYYELGYWAHNCTISMGITLFGEHVEEVDDLLIRADLAMYKAKDAGRNTLCFFDPEMQIEITNRVALEKDLHDAIVQKQFCIFYQPQIDGENRIAGAEALLRWQHPTRGWVSPTEFIPKAEKTGLILPLGKWMLEAACTQLALWANHPLTAKLTLAVNVSAREFHGEDFVDQVLETLKITGAKAHLLKLELTESLLVAKVEDLIGKMHALKARGVQFALDDFGTGYSSLSYLKRLPLDQLKIDQSFVRDILIDPDDAVIAKMVITLADSLGLTVIAEGVESQEQRDALAVMGCRSYQGYLFSQPLPAQDFQTLVAGV